MDKRNVFVAGAGYMGNGIAQVAALAGYEVVMCDVSEGCLASGMEAIESSLGKLLSREKISGEQAERALACIRTTCDLKEAAAAASLSGRPRNIELKRCSPGWTGSAAHTIIGTQPSAIHILHRRRRPGLTGWWASTSSAPCRS